MDEEAFSGRVIRVMGGGLGMWSQWWFEVLESWIWEFGVLQFWLSLGSGLDLSAVQRGSVHFISICRASGASDAVYRGNVQREKNVQQREGWVAEITACDSLPGRKSHRADAATFLCGKGSSAVKGLFFSHVALISARHGWVTAILGLCGFFCRHCVRVRMQHPAHVATGVNIMSASPTSNPG